ncbi:MAG: tetratricopeptide repeat protein [Opitutaceae bacterium]|nr:tetratricopeptide repeat protein [Opitutaceae bacterium]
MTRSLRTPRTIALFAAIFVAVFLSYSPAINGGWLWDDDAHVTSPELRSADGLKRIWIEVGATQQYYPLLHSAFWLQAQIWGDSPAAYHLVNLILHAAAAGLIVLLMRLLALPGAWLGGLIFALHPIQVESVAWISEQKNTLSAVLYLGSACLYLRFDHTRLRRYYYPAFAFFLLALMTKTVTATLPAVLLVLFWWQRGRLSWRQDIMPLLPWFLLGIGAGLFSAWVERTLIGASGSDYGLSWFERGLLAARVLCFYPAKLLWPAELVFIYPRWTVDAGVWWQYLFVLVVIATVTGLIRLARTNRGPLAAFLIYAGTIFPVLGFFNVYPFAFSYVADHFQYLGGGALIIAAAAGFTRWRAQWRGDPARVLAGLPFVVLGILVVLTWRQAQLYKDAETLYRATLRANPDCWLAHNNLGNILARDDARLEEAAWHYETVVRLRPESADAHFNLANAWSNLPAKLRAAEDAYRRAMTLQPDFAEAHNHLGNLLVRMPDRLPDAVRHYHTAIRLAPDLAEAYCNLGNALTRIDGQLPAAIENYRQAIRLRPGFIDAHFNLGNALARLPGNRDEAIACFQTALAQRPGFAEAHVNLANLLLQDRSRRHEAIAHFEAALALRPDWPALRAYLARLQQAQ